MTTSLVSAIITTKNRCKLLERAISGVKNQLYKNIEIIIVDDASNDNTEDLCRKMSDITYLRISEDESNGGNYARNIGIKACHGEFVAFCDDDDFWFENKISEQIKIMHSKPNCGMVYCGMELEIINESTNEIKKVVEYPKYFMKGDLSKKIFCDYTSMTSTMFFRKNKLVEIGLFNENIMFWQEYELSMRIAQVSHIYFVKEPLILYRINSNDKFKLGNNYEKWLKTVQDIKQMYINNYKSLNCYEFLKYRYLFDNQSIRRLEFNNVINISMKLKIEYYLLYALLLPEKILNKILN
ncbi:glycosyltransferase family 2 protein [Rhizosphaericola mali]|uniref:Glycosyltransferase n=1 Tax=Rhizosphaericola mali TaxID=2545455 RepID=A0A5P2GCK5_9BACT|nr:glycosyltransferase [Rhizosphaericola mali]QES89311.1 glycosyltransferase [Rhizosphaericola mali]